jgi:hypothetical protein
MRLSGEGFPMIRPIAFLAFYKTVMLALRHRRRPVRTRPFRLRCDHGCISPDPARVDD